MRPTIAVDFDGVLASYDHGTFHEIGPPIPGAAEFLRDLSAFGEIVIYTCRCTELLYKPRKAHLLRNEVAVWLHANGMRYDEIWIGQGKPVANLYIDDRAIRCEPERDVEAYGWALVAAEELQTEEE